MDKSITAIELKKLILSQTGNKLSRRGDSSFHVPHNKEGVLSVRSDLSVHIYLREGADADKWAWLVKAVLKGQNLPNCCAIETAMARFGY